MKRSSGLWIAGLLILQACAEITPPTPSEVLTSPLGKGPLTIGMSQEEVREIWGQPDRIKDDGRDRWGISKEIWTYEAKFPDVPIDVGYASQTKVLHFAGESLMSYSE